MLTLDQSFTFQGHTISYTALGEVEAPPLFLLHGTPFSSQVWRRLAPLFAETHRVYAHDLLGYGVSDMPDGDVSLGIQNDVFAAFVSHVGARKPHVVAHDFGGATALRAHLLNGLDYASLTLIDAVSLRPWGSAFVQHVNQHEAAFAGMPAYMHEALLYAYIPTALHGSHSRETIAVYAEPWQTAVGQAGFYRQIAQMDVKYTDDVESRYKDIRCPVQILWGEADGWLPIEVGRRLHAAIPGSTFIPIAGAGHLVQEDRPEAIAHAVQRFLTGRD